MAIWALIAAPSTRLAAKVECERFEAWKQRHLVRNGTGRGTAERSFMDAAWTHVQRAWHTYKPSSREALCKGHADGGKVGNRTGARRIIHSSSMMTYQSLLSTYLNLSFAPPSVPPSPVRVSTAVCHRCRSTPQHRHDKLHAERAHPCHGLPHGMFAPTRDPARALAPRDTQPSLWAPKTSSIQMRRSTKKTSSSFTSSSIPTSTSIMLPRRPLSGWRTERMER